MGDEPHPHDDSREPHAPSAKGLEDPAALSADSTAPSLPADPAELAEHGAAAVPPAPAPPYGSASTDPAVAMLAGGPRRHDPLSRRAKITWTIAGCAVIVAVLVVVGALVIDWS